jgi:GT2 family glycosyltransferase
VVTVLGPRVAVVVLNWNNAEDTLACLHSLCRSTVRADAIVVDNGSTDGSLQRIKDSGLAHQVVQTGQNLGYAGGNNMGLRRALTSGYEYVVVLNNDTVVSPGMLAQLMTHLDDLGDRAALTPRILYHGESRPWFAGGVIDRGWPRHLRPEELPAQRPTLADTEIITGCCIAAKASVWRQVGLFDERYFLIFEDSDWSMRARRRGVRLIVVNDATLEHRVSRSFRPGATALLGTFYYVRNGLRFHLRWQTRHAFRFCRARVIRPVVRAVVIGSERASAAMALIGVASLCLGSSGRAGPVVSHVARFLGSVRRSPIS